MLTGMPTFANISRKRNRFAPDEINNPMPENSTLLARKNLYSVVSNLHAIADANENNNSSIIRSVGDVQPTRKSCTASEILQKAACELSLEKILQKKLMQEIENRASEDQSE